MTRRGSRRPLPTNAQGPPIHFGQIVGRKNHPTSRESFPDPAECPVVHVDENENITEVLEETNEAIMPSTQKRREATEAGESLEDRDDEALEAVLEDLSEVKGGEQPSGSGGCSPRLYWTTCSSQ